MTFSLVLAFAQPSQMVAASQPPLRVGPAVSVLARSGAWRTAKPMSAPRFFHSADRLPDGRVLVAGGCSRSGAQQWREEYGWTDEKMLTAEVICLEPNPSAEIFAPSTGRWSKVADMKLARFGHFTAALPGGPRALCGKHCGGIMVMAGNIAPDEQGNYPPAEIFNPRTGTWTGVEGPRTHGQALSMPSGPKRACSRLCGKVLVVGQGIEGRSRAEAFDPVSNKWDRIAPPPVTLNGRFTLTMLASKELLLLGGFSGGPVPSSGISGGRISPANPVIYNPRQNRWRFAPAEGSLFRSGHTATLMKDDKVLVASGKLTASNILTSSAELFSPSAPTRGTGSRWKAVRKLRSAREGHLAVVLNNGGVLVLGGSPVSQGVNMPPAGSAVPGPEVFDPSTRKWEEAGKNRPVRSSRRSSAGNPLFTATPLKDGRILIAGGIDADDRGLSTVEIYRPS